MELKTPIYECHLKLKGKMVPFAGYLLPVQYETGVIKEHMAVRNNAGLFDVSHMGEFILSGKDALLNLQRVVTNDLSNMVINQVKYSPICNELGGVVDDVLIYKFNDEEYFIVVNASNRHKDYEFIKEHITGDVEFMDVSDSYAQVALQGPKSNDILLKLVKATEELPVKYYTFKRDVLVKDIPCIISRTGYTGEDGFELYCDATLGKALFEELLSAGEEYSLIPCGLGARDTLRLEAGMPLYGHEMNEEITPIEAGLGFAVKLNKEDFIGKESLLNKEVNKVRVGIKIIERGIAREGTEVFYGDRKIGIITSGTHSPYFNYPIAMALIDKEYSQVEEVHVLIRNKAVLAKIIPIPFYKRVKN